MCVYSLCSNLLRKYNETRMCQEPSKSTEMHTVYPCSLHGYTRLFGLTLVPGDVWLVPELGRVLDKLDIEPAFRASVCSRKGNDGHIWAFAECDGHRMFFMCDIDYLRMYNATGARQYAAHLGWILEGSWHYLSEVCFYAGLRECRVFASCAEILMPFFF